MIKLFQTAPAADRPALYRLVEGHGWNGDWVHVVEAVDDIWNDMSMSQLRRLRAVINGS